MFIDKRVLSDTITYVRFPLIWLVVLLHTIISPQTCNGEIYLQPGEMPVFDWFQYFSQRQIGDIAVPTFMLMSGYLFFREGKISVDIYIGKIKGRFHSLVVPYLIWNLLFLFYIFACYLLLPSILSSMGDYVRRFTFTSLLDVFLSPVLSPMWFIRDLIVLNLLAYPFYWILKRLGLSFLICLFILFLFKVWYSVPLIGIRSVFPFCLGAYIGISNQRVFAFLCKRWYWAFFLFFILFVIDTYAFLNGRIVEPLH